jgi:hypothetical protein
MPADGITLIDTGYIRPHLCAAYLVHGERGRAALVDCGTATCAGRVLEAIDAAGVAREAVDWLLVTHVHLDHAGGAQCPAGGASARRAPHGRSGEADRGREAGLWRGDVRPRPRRDAAGGRGAGGGGGGRPRGRTRRTPAAVRRHAGARAAPLQRLGRGHAQLDRGRRLRPVLPRVRQPQRRLRPADHLAGPVRPGTDEGLDPAPRRAGPGRDPHRPLRGRHRMRADCRRSGCPGGRDGGDRPRRGRRA